MVGKLQALSTLLDELDGKHGRVSLKTINVRQLLRYLLHVGKLLEVPDQCGRWRC